MTRWLAIDSGDERTGLATGDDDTRIALPLAIIERKGRSFAKVAAEICARAASEAIEAVVVGLPLHANGSEGIQAARARSLGRRIADASGLPVTYWDERMSSFIAEQRLAMLNTRRRARHSDHLAAAVILQSFFDAQQSLEPGDRDPDEAIG